MKIFVAGGTGVIGRRAVRLLVRSGHEISALARSAPKADQLQALGATPLVGSLFDPSFIDDSIIGHDAVINLATHIPALTKASRNSAWAENDRIRREGSRNLVNAVLSSGAGRYIQESLAFNYGDHGDEWIDESQPLISTPFTASVIDAEAQAARVTATGGVAVVLRFGQFYAPESSHSQAFAKLARRGWSMMPGSPDAYLATIAADDAAAAVLAALEAPAGVFNIVDSDPVTRSQWGQIMAEAVGRRRLRPPPKLLIKMAGRKAATLVSSQRVSNRAFRDATGWAPRYPSFREGVELIIPSANPSVKSSAGGEG